MKSFIYTNLAIACTTTLLMACSSSGGGGSVTVPADAITITQDNALTKAQDATSAIDSAFGAFYDATDVFFFKSSSGTLSGSKNNRHFSNFARTMIKNNKTGDPITREAPFNETINCDSGTMSINADITETNTSESGSGTISFSSCTIFGSTLNGSLSFSYSDSLSGNNWKGSGKDTASSLSMIVSGVTHTFTNFSDTWSYDDSTQIDTDKTTLSYSSSVIGGGILIQDTTAWKTRYTDLYPFEAVTLVTGANGSKFKITALDETQFNFEVDADGNGAFESSQVYAWSVLFNTF